MNRDAERPSPEQLLARYKEEERAEKTAKLKIYLGAAPGVGKTFTMMQDALAQRAQDVDVVIGIVETHGRKATEELVQYFEVLPRQLVHYRDKEISEFDLDAALKRQPDLILVDELAHTNAPGLRHTKRWQDVKELLDRGIDVYTTMNVQHIESLNDVVSQIVGTQIKETVPDSILELADTIEVVDLPTDDLIQRLHEGKVYFPAQAKLAAEHFFTKGNLNALRELALRTTAERVRVQVLLHRHGQGIDRIWQTKDVLLVCVGPGEASIKVIRAAKRLATSLRAEWYAIYIETTRTQISGEQHNSAIENLRFAEKLGAKTQVLHGMDLVKAITLFASDNNVTKIIIGKQIRPRWKDFLFRSLTDELIRHCRGIDVYVITNEERINKTSGHMTPWKKPINWFAYGMSVSAVTLFTIINFFLYPYFGTANLLMVYLLGVALVALLGQRGAATSMSILSVLAYVFFFVPPRYSFAMNNLQHIIAVVVMLIIGLIISHLAAIIRRQSRTAYLSERRTSALYHLSQQLASTRGTEPLLNVTVHYIAELFNSDVFALLADENKRLTVRAHYHTGSNLDPKDESVAKWVYDVGQMAGLGTDTLPSADSIFVPLKVASGVLGVLKIHPLDPERSFSPEEMNLLEACSNQVALALEVDQV